VIAALAIGFVPAVVSGAIGTDVAATAFAQQSESRKKKRRVPNINESTYRRLSKAEEFVELEDWQGALAELNSMLERTRRYNGNELGQAHNMLAYVNYELGAIDKTIYHYEQVLAQVPDISEAVENTVLQQLSKLYFQEGQKREGEAALVWYRKALVTMEDWLSKNENPGPDAHFYVAQIFYQMKDFDRAIARLELVVQISRERGLQVKENWWTMLQFLYFEQENWLKVIEILEILVKEFPKRTYWVNLASVYGETDQTDKQIWTLEAAHVGGFLTAESDIRTFGGLLMQEEIPNRASKYLAKGFDDEIIERNETNLRSLGQAYQMGQDVDKAIPVFEEAAGLAEDGENYDRLSSLYLEKDEFDKCRDAAQSALDKGGLRRPLVTRVILGTCQFELDQLTAARATFSEVRREARRTGATSEQRRASQWMNYIDNERERRRQLGL